MTTSLYVHIPYCKTICTYCDFCKMYYNPQQVALYLKSLEKELKSIYKNEKLKTIYIGGGTPSCLSLKELKTLFEILDMVQKEEEIEYTIECNFDSTDEAKLELFKAVGVNRLSFGLETIAKKQETYLGRKNDLEHITHIIHYAQKIGLTNINLDLMYALKDETLEDLEEDLSYLISLDVPHISTYSLMIEENTMLKLKKEQEIDPDLDFNMYKKIISVLSSNGYNHYEISNFAKKGFQSQHNLVYWKNKEYYGVGLGAASYYDQKRILNTRSITKYLKGEYRKETEYLTEEDQMVYEVLLGLRLITGVNTKMFESHYRKKLSTVFSYQNLIKKQLLKEEKGHLSIPEDKLYISNYIIEELLYGKK